MVRFFKPVLFSTFLAVSTSLSPLSAMTLDELNSYLKIDGNLADQERAQLESMFAIVSEGLREDQIAEIVSEGVFIGSKYQSSYYSKYYKTWTFLETLGRVKTLFLSQENKAKYYARKPILERYKTASKIQYIDPHFIDFIVKYEVPDEFDLHNFITKFDGLYQQGSFYSWEKTVDLMGRTFLDIEDLHQYLRPLFDLTHDFNLDHRMSMTDEFLTINSEDLYLFLNQEFQYFYKESGAKKFYIREFSALFEALQSVHASPNRQSYENNKENVSKFFRPDDHGARRNGYLYLPSAIRFYMENELPEDFNHAEFAKEYAKLHPKVTLTEGDWVVPVDVFYKIPVNARRKFIETINDLADKKNFRPHLGDISRTLSEISEPEWSNFLELFSTLKNAKVPEDLLSREKTQKGARFIHQLKTLQEVHKIYPLNGAPKGDSLSKIKRILNALDETQTQDFLTHVKTLTKAKPKRPALNDFVITLEAVYTALTGKHHIALTRITNDEHNTYTAELHDSVARSIKRLIERYGPQFRAKPVFEDFYRMMDSLEPSGFETSRRAAIEGIKGMYPGDSNLLNWFLGNLASPYLLKPDLQNNNIIMGALAYIHMKIQESLQEVVMKFRESHPNDLVTHENIFNFLIWSDLISDELCAEVLRFRESLREKVANIQRSDDEMALDLMINWFTRENHTFREGQTQVDFPTLFQLLYHALNDNASGLGQKKLTLEEMTDRKKIMRSLIISYSSEKGGPLKPACAGGFVNTLISALDGSHKDVKLVRNFGATLQGLATIENDQEFEKAVKAELRKIGSGSTKNLQYKRIIETWRAHRSIEKENQIQFQLMADFRASLAAINFGLCDDEYNSKVEEIFSFRDPRLQTEDNSQICQTLIRSAKNTRLVGQFENYAQGVVAKYDSQSGFMEYIQSLYPQYPLHMRLSLKAAAEKVWDSRMEIEAPSSAPSLKRKGRDDEAQDLPQPKRGPSFSHAEEERP